MKRFEMQQFNTCSATVASSNAPAACHAASALSLIMDTAILAVSIFICALVNLCGILNLLGLILVLVLVFLVHIMIWRADNFISPKGRINRAGKASA